MVAFGTVTEHRGKKWYAVYGNQIRGNAWLVAEPMVAGGVLDEFFSKLRVYSGAVNGALFAAQEWYPGG